MTGTDRQYSAGTVEHSAREAELLAAGKKSGHGLIGWLSAPAYQMDKPPVWQPPQSPQPPQRRPVIALLDSGVRSHPWLSDASEPPFVLNAEDLGWPSPVPDDPASGNYGSHWGHATFIAGLIRLLAPGAQVLSMRVMNSDGKVEEDDVIRTLSWLVDHPEPPGGITPDIVLMAFGRPEDPGDKHLTDLRTPIAALSDRGVRFVASAGNDGAERSVYPAAFATDSALSVLSVGALAAPKTPTERAPYSNFGPWVKEWQNGTNVLSIMPLTIPSRAALYSPLVPGPGDGYAWWSGTSFAAAIAAGKMAATLPVSQALPEPATGS